MPAIKGTFMGYKVPDKRTVLLTIRVQEWYKKQNLWEKITGVRDGEHWFSVRLGPHLLHTWRFERRKGERRSQWHRYENGSYAGHL